MRRNGDFALEPGLVIAVEPMVNMGTKHVKSLPDLWTQATQDARPSAHFEHTIAITDDGPWVLTGRARRLRRAAGPETAGGAGAAGLSEPFRRRTAAAGAVAPRGLGAESPRDGAEQPAVANFAPRGLERIGRYPYIQTLWTNGNQSVSASP